MLKIATPEDIPLVKSLALKFISNSPYKDTYSLKAIDLIVEEILKDTGDKTKFICLVHTDGVAMIAGMAQPFIYGDFLMATELAWWVDEDKRNTGIGGELLDAFEYWAKEVAGCRGLTMVSLDDALGTYYSSRAFTLTERSYLKWLH